MSVVLDLPPEIEAYLEDEARRQGRPLREVAHGFLLRWWRDLALDGSVSLSRPLLEEFQPLEPEQVRPLPPEERGALIDQIQAAYAGVPYSVDQYLQDKYAEIARENEGLTG